MIDHGWTLIQWYTYGPNKRVDSLKMLFQMILEHVFLNYIQFSSDICTRQLINITLARTANKLQKKVHEWTTEKNQSTVKK